jgi:hypothetical protein
MPEPTSRTLELESRPGTASTIRSSLCTHTAAWLSNGRWVFQYARDCRHANKII